MKKILLLCSLFTIGMGWSQPYSFQTIKEISCQPVLSQGNTGTCWSYSTISFLEAEIIRISGKKINLSEMYQVRNTYVKKAENYVSRQGKAQFSEGGLSHDVINSLQAFGLVPEEAFSGLNGQQTSHNHAELQALLEGMLKVFVENPGKKLSTNWKTSIEAVLDIYLGKNPTEFMYEGKKYTPQTFAKFTQLNPSDYVSLTSFTHAPYYSSFILNIPDNFSNGHFYNLPLEEWIACVDVALEKGYSLALDCDVSEPTFSGKHGIAVIPQEETDVKSILTESKPEMVVTASNRQAAFENLTTQDDHLMHIVGIVKDQNGKLYYKVKNSWGSDSGKDGFMYMSVAYLQLKGISVMVHRKALPEKTTKQLGL